MSQLKEITINLFLLQSINYLFFLFVLLLNKETPFLIKMLFFVNNVIVFGIYHLHLTVSNLEN